MSALFSVGLGLSYCCSIFYLRNGDRLSLLLLVTGGNMVLTSAFAMLGIASFFVFVQSTGIAILMLEVLVWKNSLPVFRDLLAAGLLAMSAVYLFAQGGFFNHAFAGTQAGGLLALAVWMGFRRLGLISGAGCAVTGAKVFAFVT